MAPEETPPAPAPAAPAAPATPPAPAPGGEGTPPAPKPGEAATPPGGEPPKPSADQATPPPKDAATPPSPEFKVPEKYKDKGWAGKVKSMDDVYEQLDQLDALKGKKLAPPDLSKATPEEREAYYAQTRPKDASEYAFNPEVPVPQELQDGVRQMLHKNGISKVQGDSVIADYQAIEAKMLEDAYSEKGMKEALTTAFGDGWEKVTAQTRTVMKGIMNEQDYASLEHIPNPYVALIYRTLGNVVKAYGITEQASAHFAANHGKPAPTDLGGQRKQIRDQMNALSRKPHTQAEMDALQTKLADTYKNDPRLNQAS